MTKPLTAGELMRLPKYTPPCMNPASIIFPDWREPITSQKSQRARELEKTIEILNPESK